MTITEKQKNHARELKKYLTINSVFSALCGIAMLLFSAELNAFFNIENKYVFPIIGVNLIVFGLFVRYVSRKQLTNRLLINLISGLDALWVLGSLLIILLGPFDLSVNGKVIIGIVAIWIGFLGYKQYTHVKKI
jgi:hypothetical protein